MISKEEFIQYTVNTKTNRLYDKRLFQHHISDLREYMDALYPGKDIKEVAYILYYNIKETPKCHYCGKPLKFHDFIHGYREYCDKSCAAQDKNPVQKTEDQIITKENILSTFLDSNGNIIEQRCLESYLKKNGWFNPLMSYYSDSESCFETIYRIINDLDDRPVCKHCGGKLKFRHGFPTFCSKKCANNDEEVVNKISVGVSYSLKESYQICGDEIKIKRQNTLLEKYGIDSCSPFVSQKFQQKAKDSIKEKYSVDNIFQLPENREKIILSNRYRSIKIRKDQGYDIDYLNINGETKILVRNGCKIHGDLILDPTLFNNRTKEERRDYMMLCPYCNPMRNPETTIEIEIKNILEKLDANYVQHDRTLIKPYELDFYLPDYNVAIECNGIYWHSGEDGGKRLLNKQNLCKDAGIRLLYFWETDIHQKTKIIESYLQSMLGMNAKIFARKCVVKEIDPKTSKNFIDANHLQGNINASIKLGLFYNGELVEVMTFGKQRKCFGGNKEDGTYELYRLCSKSGCTVVGGASKLLKHFVDNYKPEKIITYCSNDISDGNVYEKIGFKFVKDCGVGYCYIHSHTGERKNRFSLRKDVVDDGSGRTEEEINKSNGWLKCYDTGNKKYEIVF